MDVGAVCDPASQLLCGESSDLQLIRVAALGLALGWEVDEGRSGVHVELKHNQNHWYCACKLGYLT